MNLSSSYYVICVKTPIKRWLQLKRSELFSHCTACASKTKLSESCYAILVHFLLECDPQSLDDILKLGDQIYAAHPTTKLQEEILFNAFSGNTTISAISDEEGEVYAPKNFLKNITKDDDEKEVKILSAGQVVSTKCCRATIPNRQIDHLESIVIY